MPAWLLEQLPDDGPPPGPPSPFEGPNGVGSTAAPPPELLELTDPHQ